MGVSDCKDNSFNSAIAEGIFFYNQCMTGSANENSLVYNLCVEESGSSEPCSPVECSTDDHDGNDQ